MFQELDLNDQMNIEGGGPITLGLIVKGVCLAGGLIFTAGAINGCTNEAAKNKK